MNILNILGLILLEYSILGLITKYFVTDRPCILLSVVY